MEHVRKNDIIYIEISWTLLLLKAVLFFSQHIGSIFWATDSGTEPTVLFFHDVVLFCLKLHISSLLLKPEDWGWKKEKSYFTTLKKGRSHLILVFANASFFPLLPLFQFSIRKSFYVRVPLLSSVYWSGKAGWSIISFLFSFHIFCFRWSLCWICLCHRSWNRVSRELPVRGTFSSERAVSFCKLRHQHVVYAAEQPPND